MLKTISLIILFAAAAIAQQQLQPKTHTMRGTVKDSAGAVVNGLMLMVNGKGISRTDINGEFTIDLTEGDHVLTINSTDLYLFRAFIKVSDRGPNPDNVGFVVDTSKVCCSDAGGRPFAKALSLPRPDYPVAARVVRAGGEVVVTLTLDADGKVSSAKALNGHPLLRGAAVNAAKRARFESPVKDANSIGQEIRLTYVFILHDEKGRDGTLRYTNPYRIDVIAQPGIVTFSRTRPQVVTGGEAGCGWVLGGSFGRLRLNGHVQMQQSS